MDSAYIKSSDMPGLIGGSPIMKATVAGVDVDTGSQVSLISEQFFREHVQSTGCNLLAANNWLTSYPRSDCSQPCYVGCS